MDATIQIVTLGAPPSRRRQLTEYRGLLRWDPCSYCGASSENVDHIHSPWLGGEDFWTNMTAACARCNRSKGSRSLLAFLSGLAVGDDHREKEKRRIAAYYASVGR